MSDALARLLGVWTAPPDGPALGAAVAAGIALLAALLPQSSLRAHLLEGPWRLRRRTFLLGAGFAAAFLSLGYAAFYLRGAPRIIDATAYFLQGRALAGGDLTFPLPLPSASFRGRFLLAPAGEALAGIFPPGYPLLLSLGFLLGAPLVVGPLLAGALATATYFLTRELAAHGPREAMARTAALLSVACASLRYHTADTMAHGAAALGVTLALTCALRARRAECDESPALPGAWWLGAGAAVGFVLATRIASSFAVGLVVVALAARARRRLLASGALMAGALPGALLLLASQAAATGSPFTPAQLAYYATSDGPPGCFRYGFGAGVGCVVEHGDVVRRDLTHGYGAGEAALTTLRRLWYHVADIANGGPLAVLVLLPFATAWRPAPRSALAPARAAARRAVLAAGSVVVLHILAYAPFYFQGSYGGGGARLFADVLPLEHALAAVGIATLAPRVPYARKAAVAVGAALALFAVHGVHGHRELAARDGGRPFFEPDVVEAAGARSGLLFVDTDHGFLLGHRPKLQGSQGLTVARLLRDDRDRLLWESLGSPPSFVYKVHEGAAHVTAWTPGLTPTTQLGYRFEAEHEWPPFAQRGGWVEPRWASDTCASGGRVLALHAAEDGEAEAWLELPVPAAGTWEITATVLHTPPGAPPGTEAGTKPGAEAGTTAGPMPGAEAGTTPRPMPGAEAGTTPPEAPGRLEVHPWTRPSGESPPWRSPGAPLATMAWENAVPDASAQGPRCVSLPPVTAPLEAKRAALRFVVPGGNRGAAALLDRVTLRRLP